MNGCLHWEAAGSRLSGQHDAVGAVQHGVGHICRLCARRPRVLDHALQHLGGGNDRLASLPFTFTLISAFLLFLVCS